MSGKSAGGYTGCTSGVFSMSVGTGLAVAACWGAVAASAWSPFITGAGFILTLAGALVGTAIIAAH